MFAENIEGFFRFLISEYSYLGLFIVQVISSASILVPVPGYVAVLVAGAKLDPFGVAVSSGLGSAVGELSGYLVGCGGMRFIAQRSQRIQEQESRLEVLRSLLFRYGAGAIFLFAASPLPFDFAGILFGTLNFDLNAFFLLTFAGKTTKYLLLAFTGKGLFEIFQSLLEGRFDIYSLLMVALVVLLVLVPLVFLVRARLSSIMSAKDVMTSPVETIGVDAAVIEAVTRMNKSRHGSILVMENDELVGIITERDILERIVEQFADPKALKVDKIMSSPVVTIPPDMKIDEAAKLMAKNNIKKLPVIEDGKLVGIVTSMDLVRAGPRLLDLLEDLMRIGK